MITPITDSNDNILFERGARSGVGRVPLRITSVRTRVTRLLAAVEAVVDSAGVSNGP